MLFNSVLKVSFQIIFNKYNEAKKAFQQYIYLAMRGVSEHQFYYF